VGLSVVHNAADSCSAREKISLQVLIKVQMFEIDIVSTVQSEVYKTFAEQLKWP